MTKKPEQDSNTFSVVVDKILNYKDKGKFELKICLMQASDILKDKHHEPCALTSDDFAADNMVLDFDQEQFDFDINLNEIEDEQEEVVLIMYLNKAIGNKTPIMWNFWPLF